MLSLGRRFNDVLHAGEKSLKRLSEACCVPDTQQGANETTNLLLHRCLVKEFGECASSRKG
jgi:hypothetical protein